MCRAAGSGRCVHALTGKFVYAQEKTRWFASSSNHRQLTMQTPCGYAAGRYTAHFICYRGTIASNNFDHSLLCRDLQLCISQRVKEKRHSQSFYLP